MYAFNFYFGRIFTILFLRTRAICYIKTLYNNAIRCYNVIVLCPFKCAHALMGNTNTQRQTKEHIKESFDGREISDG